MERKGYFISLEGIDGCGKSTLKEYMLDKLKSYEIVTVREPGGTYISEKIRDILLDIKNHSIKPKTEAILYAAARSQVTEEIIWPALIRGKIVIADRYIDSTIAYQGYGRGLDITFLEDLHNLSTGGLKPNLTFLLDISPEEAIGRKRQEVPDRLESEGLEFQRSVRKGYLQIASQEPQRIKLLDASKDTAEVGIEAIGHLTAVMDYKQG